MNNTNSIPVEFNRDTSLYHDEIKTSTIDTMQIYNDEKDSSSKHRFIFTLYPICTNALFNKITEVIYKEGSADCKILAGEEIIDKTKITPTPISTVRKIDRLQAIRNTEYTNYSGLTYHCGVDIFNNHLLRHKEQISIQRRNESAETGCTVYIGTITGEIAGTGNTQYISDTFNTIADYSRNDSGMDIKTLIPQSVDNYCFKTDTTEYTSSLYSKNNIYSLTDAYAANIKRKNGWWGFTNPSTIAIPVSGTSYYVNKLFNNKEACQYIDMCPERDLFSFTPKKNPYRKRLEYNWDYCLTYPYKSDYESSFLSGRTIGLPIIELTPNISDTISSNGLNIKVFQCPVKHNLSIGDYVNLKYIDNGETYSAKCEVIKLGNLQEEYKDRCFGVLKFDYNDIFPTGTTPQYFTKVVSGFECEYYFRKFKKIDGDLKSNLSRLAFANTIYGDEVSQLIFTDDVNIEGLKDNRGRPLTEIYLTLIKRNSGYKEWYNYNDNDTGNSDISGETIEYSHVFGEVTSGLDLPDYVGTDYPSIRKQHNIKIDSGDTYSISNIKIDKSSEKLECDLPYSVYSTRSQVDEFFGDLVEFNPIEVMETTLEDVYHRFNTAQREVINKSYDTIYDDEINNTDNNGKTKINCISLNEEFANLDPEGYIYKPHYKIQINKFEDLVRQSSDSLINDIRNFVLTTATTVDTLIITATTNNYLQTGDIIGVLDKSTKEVKQYIVNKHKIENGYFITECFTKSGTGFNNEQNNNKRLFKYNSNIPEYAYMLPDGSGRHLWRNVLKPSEWTFLDDIYNTPFSNGAFYHHTNINLFVKRQDPFKKYQLYIKNVENGREYENNFAIPSNELSFSEDEYITENKTTCF